MDDDVREEILDNQFANELGLHAIVRKIDDVYRQIEYGASWRNVEPDIVSLKEDLEVKAKEHELFQKHCGNWQNKLAVVHSKHPDQTTFVTAIWDLIMSAEAAYFPQDSTGHLKVGILLEEVSDTARACGTGAKFFPLGHMVNELEEYSYWYEANPERVQQELIQLDLPFKKLYTTYRSLDFFDEDLEDEWEGLPTHHLQAFASVIQSFMRKHKDLNLDDFDRQSVLEMSRGDVQRCLNTMLQNRDDYSTNLINRYRRLSISLQNFVV